MSACRVCSSDKRGDIELIGSQALNGEASWRAAAQAAEVTHQSLKNHMENHYVHPDTTGELAAAQVLDNELSRLMLQTEAELLDQMSRAPAEVKPLYAVAVRNLRGIKETRPSQRNLIDALRTVHEVTGMRMEQRLMLEFAKAAFGPSAATGVIDSTVAKAALPEAE
jgi:hypothetical protein